MATDLERLVVQLSADVKKYENSLNRAMGNTNKTARGIERRFKDMNKNISGTLSNALRGTTALVGGGLGIREIQQYADAWMEAGNLIRASAAANGVQTRSLDDLTKSANEARTSFSDYTELYARLIRSASKVVDSEQDIADITDTVAKALKAGGATAQETSASLIQLGQALGSGVLQGDELRSLRENAPILAQAIAKEFDTSIAGLKKLGAAGKLESARVAKAILNARDDVERQFKSTNATIGDSFTILRNNLQQYIGNAAQAVGVSQTVSEIMAALSGNISSVANAAAAAGVALLAMSARAAVLGTIAALTNPFVALAVALGAAAYAATEFWDTVIPLQGSLATLGDYASALWTVLSEGAIAVKQDVVSAFETVFKAINDALSGVGTSIDGVWRTIKSSVDNIIGSFVGLAAAIGVAFDKVPAAVADAVLTTMNTMIAGVETAINKVISAVDTAIKSLNSLGEFAGISPIDEIKPVDLGRLKNDYAGAGKALGESVGKAYADGFGNYVDSAANAVVGVYSNAEAKLTALANQAHRERIANQKDADNAPGAAYAHGGATAGFGGGIPGSGGTGKTHAIKKTAEDAFNQDIQRIKDRTAALASEQQALGMSFYEQQRRETSLKLEQQALKDVQEAARKKGDTDWRNAQLTPDQIKQIDEVSAAYARQADDLRKAQAVFDLQRDVVKGVFDDFRSALEDGKLDWKDFSNIALNALNKIVDKIENDLIDAIFSANSAMSGGGGSGGGFWSLITSGIGSLFGGGSYGSYGPGITGDPWAGLRFAGGTNFAPGGPSIINEKGGEIVDLPRGSRVIPHDVSMAMARSSGPSTTVVSPQISIDARGAQQGVGAEIKQALDSYSRHTLPQLIKQVNADPRRRG